MNWVRFRVNSRFDSNGANLRLNLVQKLPFIFPIIYLDDVSQTLLFVNIVISGRNRTHFLGTFHLSY